MARKIHHIDLSPTSDELKFTSMNESYFNQKPKNPKEVIRKKRALAILGLSMFGIGLSSFSANLDKSQTKFWLGGQFSFTGYTWFFLLLAMTSIGYLWFQTFRSKSDL